MRPGQIWKLSLEMNLGNKKLLSKRVTHIFISLNLKFNEPITSWSSPISDTLYQVKRALNEMPRLKEGNASTFLDYMSEQIFIEQSLSSIFQFLRYLYIFFNGWGLTDMFLTRINVCILWTASKDAQNCRLESQRHSAPLIFLKIYSSHHKTI